MISMCSGSSAWSRPPFKRAMDRTPDDAGLAFSNFDPPPDQYLFVSDLEQRDEKPAIASTEPSAYSDDSHHQHFSSGPASSPAPSFVEGSRCPPTTSFTATNPDNMHTRDVPDARWLSPLQTQFKSDPSMYESYNSISSFPAADCALSATSTAPTQWSYVPDQKATSSPERRRRSSQQLASAPFPIGRRRMSEKAEPGSARAVYLEKNRHAASKCRTKQKRQQEDLVETAREGERKNKVLKSEVEVLKKDLRDLMEQVGRHNDCPDGRLRKYLQLEADRLSQKGSRSMMAEYYSSKASSNGDTSSPVRT